MSNQISTQTISFYGSELLTLKIEDVIYTAVKPIVEALGLSWGTQKRKLIDQQEKFNWVHMNSVAEDGKMREMICMPLKKLNGWLFSINPEKVRPDLKEKVIQYQEECFEALYNYWHFGKAERNLQVEQLSVQQDEEALHIIVNLFHSLNGAYDMSEKIRNNAPHIGREIDKELGGYHLYNLNEPTRQALDKARKYIQAKSERIMFVKGMLSLLEEPKRIAN